VLDFAEAGDLVASSLEVLDHRLGFGAGALVVMLRAVAQGHQARQESGTTGAAGGRGDKGLVEGEPGRREFGHRGGDGVAGGIVDGGVVAPVVVGDVKHDVRFVGSSELKCRQKGEEIDKAGHGWGSRDEN